MFPVLLGVLALISVAALAFQFAAALRLLRSDARIQPATSSVNRYQPMLRLLSEDDVRFVSGNRVLSKKLRAQRQDIFKGYLRCLTKDYGKLLAGVRLAMVNSGVDRPDLARALAKNKILFAWALCRIELRLSLYSLGLAKVDVSGLVEAMDALRGQVSFLAPASLAA